MEEDLIPLMGIVVCVGLPLLLAILVSLETVKSRHKEKMAMIEKGILLEEKSLARRDPNRYQALRNGMLMVGLALGALVGIFVSDMCGNMSDQWWTNLLVPAMTILFGGIAFVLYFFISRSLMEREK